MSYIDILALILLSSSSVLYFLVAQARFFNMVGWCCVDKATVELGPLGGVGLLLAHGLGGVGCILGGILSIRGSLLFLRL